MSAPTADRLDEADVVDLLGGLHAELLALQGELAAIDGTIAQREAEAILRAETPAADASLALVQRCLDDMLRSVRDEVRSSVEEPAEWAAAERLRVARRRAEAVRAGDEQRVDHEVADFDAFWREQAEAVEARSDALSYLAPLGAAIPVAAIIAGGLALLHFV